LVDEWPLDGRRQPLFPGAELITKGFLAGFWRQSGDLLEAFAIAILNQRDLARRAAASAPAPCWAAAGFLHY
jgi:hypothetical protein